MADKSLWTAGDNIANKEADVISVASTDPQDPESLRHTIKSNEDTIAALQAQNQDMKQTLSQARLKNKSEGFMKYRQAWIDFAEKECYKGVMGDWPLAFTEEQKEGFEDMVDRRYMAQRMKFIDDFEKLCEERKAAAAAGEEEGEDEGEEEGEDEGGDEMEGGREDKDEDEGAGSEGSRK